MKKNIFLFKMPIFYIFVLIILSVTVYLNNCEYKQVYGIIDKTGKFIVKPIYSEIFYFYKGYAAVKLEDKLGIIDMAGNYVIKPSYKPTDKYIDSIEFADEWSKVIKNKKIGEFSRTYNSDEKRPVYISSRQEGLLAVKVNNKWGFIDSTGKFVIKPKFNSADNFNEGLALIKENNKYGFINKTGEYIVKPQYDFASGYSEGLAQVVTGKVTNGKYGFVDKAGKLVINPQYHYDIMNGQGVMSNMSKFKEGFVVINQNGKFGYIDETGKTVIDPKYEEANSFFKNVAIIKQNNKYG